MEKEQTHRRRYESRRKAAFIGFSAAAALLAGVIICHSGKFQPVWLLLIILPLLAVRIQSKAPLRFNRRGMAWTYVLCEEKTLPRTGFIYWHDIEAFTWQPLSETKGGSVEIQFPRGALQSHFPEENTPVPEKRHGELITMVLLLYCLDADSGQVFQQMQTLWQQAHAQTAADN